jgi:hypothetical protein
LRVTNAEPEAIANHFTEACLDDLAIESWGERTAREKARTVNRLQKPLSRADLSQRVG